MEKCKKWCRNPLYANVHWRETHAYASWRHFTSTVVLDFLLSPFRILSPSVVFSTNLRSEDSYICLTHSDFQFQQLLFFHCFFCFRFYIFQTGAENSPRTLLLGHSGLDPLPPCSHFDSVFLDFFFLICCRICLWNFRLCSLVWYWLARSVMIFLEIMFAS